MSMKTVFRLVLRVTLVLLIVTVAFVGFDRWVVLSSYSASYTNVLSVPSSEVILVFGSRIYGGEVSAILEDRLKAAFDLYQAGKAPKILVSGDYSSPYYDEAAAMSQYLKRRGIPERAILLDHAGYSTYDSLMRAKNVFGIRHVIVVSQDFHLPRALFIARSIGLSAVGFDASLTPLTKSALFYNGWREPLARIKALYDVVHGTQPSYSGTGLPVDKKGNVQRN